MGGLLKKIMQKPVKLVFSTCGAVMINDMPFTFGVESGGRRSEKGICVSISGDAVDNGSVTFSDLEYNENHNGHITVVKCPLTKQKKEDGKFIYKAVFDKIPIVEMGVTKLLHKTTEDEILERINAEISFRVTPHYTGSETPEIMLTVYPYENVLTGSCVQWVNCTSDKNYFLNKYTNQEK